MSLHNKTFWEGFKELEWHAAQIALLAISIFGYVVGLHDLLTFFTIVSAATDDVDPDTSSMAQAIIALLIAVCATIYYHHRKLKRAAETEE